MATTSVGLPLENTSSTTDQAKPFSTIVEELMGENNPDSAMNQLNKAIPVLKTAAQWTADTTIVLDVGQMGVESDTTKFKFGDGTNTWVNLSYVADTATAVVLTDGAEKYAVAASVVGGALALTYTEIE